MKKIKVLSCAGILASLLLMGCNSDKPVEEPKKDDKQQQPTPNPQPVVPEKDIANVFILTGQSNMEGQSSHGYDIANDKWSNNPYLKNAMEELECSADDIDACVHGIDNVYTSYYGTGYGELDQANIVHSSAPGSTLEDKIKGNFLKTKVGMGNTDNYMGPELGLAYKLAEHADEDTPIYFIKCAVSGSGFAQSGTKYNWDISKEDNYYDLRMKTYVNNCLNLIKETGKDPVIRGFLWQQGESDTDSAKIPLYRDRLDALLTKFRTDYKEYAEDEDENNIAFIDCYTYDKNGGLVNDLNAVKKAYSEEEGKNNFIVNSSWQIEGGLKLENGNPGGNGNLHYTTKSCFQVGMAYADIIIDNNLLGE